MEFSRSRVRNLDTGRFEVEDSGEVQKAIVYDDYTKTDISKTEITTGKELPGAHLQVIDSTGTVIAEWTTDGTVHRINGLVPGDYTLRETSAPDGYEVAEKVSFTSSPTARYVRSQWRTGHPTGPMPTTGDNLPWWAIALGIGALAAGTGALLFSKGSSSRDGVEPNTEIETEDTETASE